MFHGYVLKGGSGCMATGLKEPSPAELWYGLLFATYDGTITTACSNE